jgi:hypothetical protein
LSIVMAGMTAMTGTSYFIDLKSNILYEITSIDNYT